MSVINSLSVNVANAEIVVTSMFIELGSWISSVWETCIILCFIKWKYVVHPSLCNVTCIKIIINYSICTYPAKYSLKFNFHSMYAVITGRGGGSLHNWVHLEILDNVFEYHKYIRWSSLNTKTAQCNCHVLELDISLIDISSDMSLNVFCHDLVKMLQIKFTCHLRSIKAVLSSLRCHAHKYR